MCGLNPQGGIDGAHAIVVLTEGDEFKTYDYQAVQSKLMKHAFVFDGRNMLKHRDLEALGHEVHATGKGMTAAANGQPEA